MSLKYLWVFVIATVLIILCINLVFNQTPHTQYYEYLDYSQDASAPNTSDKLLQSINTQWSHRDSDENANDCDLLYCNQREFDLMVSYYTSISNISYPRSWSQLNDQLFCPIKYSSAINTDDISNAGERLLQYLYANQFKSNCFDPRHKYLFYDTKGWYTGLGATTNGGIIKYFTRALMANYTFIMVGDWDWNLNAKHCEKLHRTGFNCYFLAMSNCKYDDIIKHIDINDPKQFLKTQGLPKDCSIGDFPDRPWCQQRVIYVLNQGAGWYPQNADIQKWIHEQQFVNFPQYKAILISFVYRLQPNVRDIIYRKIQNAFTKSLQLGNDSSSLQSPRMHEFDPFATIAFPIRASDKCYGNKIGARGEMDCWSIDEIDNLLFAVHSLKPSINAVIFTSEDIHFIDKLIEKIESNAKYEDGFKWTIIINHDDSKPGSGETKRGQTANGGGSEPATTDFEHDVIVGALSSLLLQTSNAKYVIHTKSSSWLDNLWTIASQLDCDSVFWSKQLEIKGFQSREMNAIPPFLHDANKKYHRMEKMCFELKQQGLLNKKTKQKHVIFPADIYDSIHANNLDPVAFKEKFGIDILEYGWRDYCQRYSHAPFHLDQDILL